MKGIVNIIEVAITGMILVLAFFHFFPKYSIKSNWDNVLLLTQVKDILNVIDNMDRLHTYATNTQEFNEFMENILATSEKGAVIWWKQTDGLGFENPRIPHFTKAKKATMVDVTDMIFYDDFNNTNDLWKPSEGEWILENEKYKGSSSTNGISLVYFNITDVEIKSKINIESGSRGGIVFRIQNNTDYYTFVGDAQKNKWQLEKWKNNNPVIIESVNDQVNTNEEYNLTIIINGTNFEGYVNNNLTITHDSLDYNNGYSGLFVDDSTTYFDDFSIKKFTIYSFTLVIGYPY